jgi:hypothetical protein
MLKYLCKEIILFARGIDMIKKIIGRTLSGISYGCFWMVCYCMIFNFMSDKTHFEFLMNNFTIQAIGSMLVGIGFVLPTLIYDSEKFSLFVKTIIHLGIGVPFFFAVGFYLGWLPKDLGMRSIFLMIVGCIAVSFAIWFGFYLYNKNESKLINKQLKKIEEKE